MPTSFQPTRFPTSSFDSERQPNYAASDKPTEIPEVPLGLSGPSFKQQLQTDPWYQQLARLTQDVDQLEDGGRQQTQAWLQLSNSVLSPEASCGAHATDFGRSRERSEGLAGVIRVATRNIWQRRQNPIGTGRLRTEGGTMRKALASIGIFALFFVAGGDRLSHSQPPSPCRVMAKRISSLVNQSCLRQVRRAARITRHAMNPMQGCPIQGCNLLHILQHKSTICHKAIRRI